MEYRNVDDYEKFIFVEGDDDFHFLCNLLDTMSIKDVCITKVDGKSKLKPAIKAFKKRDNFPQTKSLSIVVDADESFESTVESVKNTMLEVGIPAPENHGLSIEKDGLKTSMFVMPGINLTGAIEDLIITHAEKKMIFVKINDFFEDLKKSEMEIKESDSEYKYPSNDKKAKVQVYLSCHHDSDTRIGTSIKKKIINTDDDVFDEIKKFISEI